MQHVHALVAAFLIFAAGAVLATDKPDCNRPLTLALHDHGLLYSSDTGTGIDKDVADELIRRSGCKIRISVMPRARIWQLIESGALDFSLSGITNAERERFAGFAWYFANKYYLLVRRDAGVAEQAAFERQPTITEKVNAFAAREFVFGSAIASHVTFLYCGTCGGMPCLSYSNLPKVAEPSGGYSDRRRAFTRSRVGGRATSQ